MIKTGNPIISIYTEETPNPQTLKFVANKLLYPGKTADFPDENAATGSPLAQQLFAFPFVKSVFIASNFVTLTRTDDIENWDDVVPSIKQFLKDYIEEGGVIINEDVLSRSKTDTNNSISADDGDTVKKIKEVLKNYVAPAVEMDGGAIQFQSFQDGILNLKMLGSCSGCPSSMITLKAGVEKIIMRMVPEVKEVVAAS